MTLRHFEIFKTVCSLGSITAAADSLNMTQPAVSIAIKELEAFYNVKLFERMNRRIYITQAGESLLQYADTVLSQFDESVNVIKNGGLYNRCSLGVNVTIGETMLANVIDHVKKELPDASLKIHIESSQSIESLLLANKIDFAVVDGFSSKDSCKAYLLGSKKMVAVCSRSYLKEGTALNTIQLAKERLLLREKGSGSRICVDGLFLSHGCITEPYVESSSSLSLIDFAKKGLGIAILPQSLVDEELGTGALITIPILDAQLERSFYIIYHKNKYLTPVMKSVIALFKSCWT